MRDNHDGYPELLDAYEREGSYFGAVRVILTGEEATFEFGLVERGYLSLKRVLQSRPFEPRGQYRYFFRGKFGKREGGNVLRTQSRLAFALSNGQTERASISMGQCRLSLICCGFSR